MDYDVSRVRQQFPALQYAAAHFDGPGGTQTPEPVAQAVAQALVDPLSNRGRNTPSERNADGIVASGRTAMAALLGAEPEGIAFGRSATQIMTDLARALSRSWGPGDEIVVSRIDHDANIRPWVDAAGDAGATIRWIDFDPVSADVPIDASRAVIGKRTKLVALTAASNFFGTIPDVSAVASLAREVGAWFVVDGVHFSAHAFVDIEDLGADVFVCSPYKFCGPHIGVLAGRSETLAKIAPYKLRPSPDAVPERFELGTLPYEQIAGVSAAVDFLAGLVPPEFPDDPLRARLEHAIGELTDYEDMMFDRLTTDLSAINGVELLGNPNRRTPTALFTVSGMAPADVAAALGARDVCVTGGHMYAIEAAEWAGLPDGAVRAGIAPYTTEDDIRRLVDSLKDVTAAR